MGCNKAPQPYQRALFLTSLPSSNVPVTTGPVALPAEGGTSEACGCNRRPSLLCGFNSPLRLISQQEDRAPWRVGDAGYASAKGLNVVLGRSGTRGMRFVVALCASGEANNAKRKFIYKSVTVTFTPTSKRLGCSHGQGQGRGWDKAQHTGDLDAIGLPKRRKGAVSAPFPKVCVEQLSRNMFGSTRALFSSLPCPSQSLQEVQRVHTHAKDSYLTSLQSATHYDHTPQRLQRGAPGASTPVPCYPQVPA
jgi:hypothetical protein